MECITAIIHPLLYEQGYRIEQKIFIQIYGQNQLLEGKILNRTQLAEKKSVKPVRLDKMYCHSQWCKM